MAVEGRPMGKQWAHKGPSADALAVGGTISNFRMFAVIIDQSLSPRTRLLPEHWPTDSLQVVCCSMNPVEFSRRIDKNSDYSATFMEVDKSF